MTTDVLTPLIDWTRRPSDTDGPTGPVTFDVVSPRGGNWAIVPRVPGEILTAAKYNADRQASVDNDAPLSIDDYSNTLAEMQAETNPYPSGAVSQPTSLAGELERLRWCMHQLNPSAPAWYAVPHTGISLGSINVAALTVTGNVTVGGGITATGHVFAHNFIMPNSNALISYLVGDVTQQSLLFINSVDNIHLGQGLPTNRAIVFGSGGPVQAVGPFTASAGVAITGRLTLVKDEWVYWGDRAGIVVGSDNKLHLGLNCDALVIYPPVTVNQSLSVGTTLQMVKNQWLYWGDMPALRVTTGNVVDLGFNTAGLTVYPGTAFQNPISVAGSVTLTKGQWVMGGDIQMIAAAVDNAVHVGSNAVAVRLGAPTAIAGTLGTTGDIVAGSTGTAAVYGRNVARAWARIQMSPLVFLAGHNILSLERLGVGAVRLTLGAGVPDWSAAVATPEGWAPESLICTTSMISARVVDVAVRSAATGAAMDFYFSVVMY